MAHLVKPWVVRWLDGKTWKRVPKGTPGAKKERTRARKWYGVGIPGFPPKKRIPLASDKEAARRMLADLVRRGEQGQAGLHDRDASRLPLKDLLAAFESDLALGLAGKRSRQKATPSDTQVKLVVQRARDAFLGCGIGHTADLNAEAPAKVAKYLKARLGKPRKEGGLSAQSAAFFLAAVRRFARWISARAPVRPDLFDTIPGFDPQNNRLHARREVSPEELARLIDTTRASTHVVRGLAGPDRAMLYLVAFATGYRAGELAELCPENFELDTAHPAAVLPGRLTKNKKTAQQPLPAGLVAQLRGYLSGKPTGKPVWPGTWGDRPVAVLRHDLAAADVTYCVQALDGPRYADFHALRHSYLSALAAAGVGPKELQELARHTDPRITLGVYTHARPESLGAAVARLKLPGSAEENPLARMSRAELEAAVVALAVVVRSLVAPPVAPTGDAIGELPETT